MRDLYILTAIPAFLAESEDKGQLDSVTFTASNGDVRYAYSSINTGTYVEDFNLILSREEAEEIVAQLCAGETVTFPGMWRLDQVWLRFGRTSCN